MATYWENSCSFGLRYVSWYKCLIVSLVFSHLGFWSGNLFLIAHFPDLCLLVPFFISPGLQNLAFIQYDPSGQMIDLCLDDLDLFIAEFPDSWELSVGNAANRDIII